MRRMNARRLTRLALLTGIALTIFVVEAQLPPLAPIPGIKPGLANIVTVWALFTLGPLDALLILLARILLASMYAGQVMALLYSLCGGLLSYAVSLAARRLVSDRQLWAVSILGGIAHNVGQLLAATAVLGTGAVWYYAPVLGISGLLAGAFTGAAAQFLYNRLQNIRFFKR